MSHAEGSFARFLKDASNVDKSRAAIMLRASGKTLSLTATNRIQLRDPLVRLYRDIETFQFRAVTDTYDTIDKMEGARTSYRAALLWMKDISQKLDPDTYNQLEKFRKVQAHVRRSKDKFEKIKLDTHQKIDMLAASRVNMLNNALAVYQRGLLNFYKRASETLSSVSEVFNGFQYFEFTVVKELRDNEKKQRDLECIRDTERKLRAIFGEEKDVDKSSLLPLQSTEKRQHDGKHESPGESIDQCMNDLLRLNEPTDSILDFDLNSMENKSPASSSVKNDLHEKQSLQDLLTQCEPDEKELLSEIFSTSTTEECPPLIGLSGASSDTSSSYLPSQLLADMPLPTHTSQEQSSSTGTAASKSTRKDPLDKWFNLFAELDPLSNPDSIGSTTDQDRNC